MRDFVLYFVTALIAIHVYIFVAFGQFLSADDYKICKQALERTTAK